MSTRLFGFSQPKFTLVEIDAGFDIKMWVTSCLGYHGGTGGPGLSSPYRAHGFTTAYKKIVAAYSVTVMLSPIALSCSLNLST